MYLGHYSFHFFCPSLKSFLEVHKENLEYHYVTKILMA